MEFNETMEAFFCVNDRDLGPAVDRAVRLEGKTLASILGIEGGGVTDEGDNGADEPSGDDQDQVEEVVDHEDVPDVFGDVDEGEDGEPNDFPTGSDFDTERAN